MERHVIQERILEDKRLFQEFVSGKCEIANRQYLEQKLENVHFAIDRLSQYCEFNLQQYNDAYKETAQAFTGYLLRMLGNRSES